MSGFKQAVGCRQGVVEESVVGEVAHREVVDPANWARVTGAFEVNSLDKKSAGEHGFTLKQLTVRAGPAAASRQSSAISQTNYDYELSTKNSAALLLLTRDHLRIFRLLRVDSKDLIVVVPLGEVLAHVFEQKNARLHGALASSGEP